MFFLNVMNNFADLLRNDVDIKNYIITEFGKEHTVEITYKDRKSINSSQLPLMFLTRPSKDSLAVHNIRLYCGVYQKDKHRGVVNTIEIEELIETAITKNITLNARGQITFKDSANDEGVYTPYYYFVKDFAYTEM